MPNSRSSQTLKSPLPPVALAALFADFVDVLIPGDGKWPSASAVGVQGLLLSRVVEEWGEAAAASDRGRADRLRRAVCRPRRGRAQGDRRETGSDAGRALRTAAVGRHTRLLRKPGGRRGHSRARAAVSSHAASGRLSEPPLRRGAGQAQAWPRPIRSDGRRRAGRSIGPRSRHQTTHRAGGSRDNHATSPATFSSLGPARPARWQPSSWRRQASTWSA